MSIEISDTITVPELIIVITVVKIGDDYVELRIDNPHASNPFEMVRDIRLEKDWSVTLMTTGKD